MSRQTKGPEGKRPTKYIGTEQNPILATRANLRKQWYLAKKAHARSKRRVEYASYKTRGMNGAIITTFIKDKDGNKIPVRVLHETKGWQSARIAA